MLIKQESINQSLIKHQNRPRPLIIIKLGNPLYLSELRNAIYHISQHLNGTVESKPTHYLMGLGPNTKKIPQNSGKQIRIPEGM